LLVARFSGGASHLAVLLPQSQAALPAPSSRLASWAPRSENRATAGFSALKSADPL